MQEIDFAAPVSALSRRSGVPLSPLPQDGAKPDSTAIPVGTGLPGRRAAAKRSRERPAKMRTDLVRNSQFPHLKGALLLGPILINAPERPLLSQARHFRALACNLLSCEAGKLGRLSAPSNTLFPGQRPTAL